MAVIKNRPGARLNGAVKFSIRWEKTLCTARRRRGKTVYTKNFTPCQVENQANAHYTIYT